MSRLQKKPPAHKRGHPTLQSMNFSYFCGSFLPSWIRIRIQITDPDPMVRLNTDPIRIRIRIRNPALWEKGRIRIRTSDYRIQIQEDQKNADPADPDPQHWSRLWMNFRTWLRKCGSRFLPFRTKNYKIFEWNWSGSHFIQHMYKYVLQNKISSLSIRGYLIWENKYRPVNKSNSVNIAAELLHRSMLGIREILVRIRIRLLSSVTLRMQRKWFFSYFFF